MATLGAATLAEALGGHSASRTRRNTLEGAKEILLRQVVAALLNQARLGSAFPAESVASTPAELADALASGDRDANLALADTQDPWNNNLAFDATTGSWVPGGSCPM